LTPCGGLALWGAPASHWILRVGAATLLSASASLHKLAGTFSAVNRRETRRLQVMRRMLDGTDQCRLNDHSTGSFGARTLRSRRGATV
jgi:hypothetical protein